MSTTTLLRQEWRAFRRPSRLIALAAAALSLIGLGLLFAAGNHASCAGPCPGPTVAADGSVVGDRFWFLHHDLGRDGSITVRLTGMSGTITYPPPDHDKIVPGLVPWAKTGIIVKDGTRPGSRYAALMMTGHHGVRFQYDYTHDVAGSAGDAGDVEFPRWLRLTRSGATIAGAESTDGRQWHPVGSATLAGLPDTVQVGLFATSPGDLTLRATGLGGATEQVRFTQAVGVFDNVTVGGGAGGWVSGSVGEMNHTDWEKSHNPSGAVQRGGVITISGTGDIGPASEDAPIAVETTLLGLLVALVVVVVVAARYGARERLTRRVLAARAAVVGLAAAGTGLVGVGVVLPMAAGVLRGNGILVRPTSVLTEVRVVVGVALVLGLCAVVAFGIGAWLRRRWWAALCGLLLIAAPLVATIPLLPDGVAGWLLRLTPAAGFAVEQTVVAYPQVTAHHAPSAGYFPLPWWAGLLVLGAYAAVALWPACAPRRSAESTDWR